MVGGTYEDLLLGVEDELVCLNSGLELGIGEHG